ncbi:FecR family protein [Sphingobacterium sp. SYP-B4668]|uniref:FecR family protein n=1 Tax=Sphingobacterium sp. SYP-B4668 TaxID=2996035 RepID=UPI0022DE2684|nr:FecR family protein [Sphingobacterium sp. SYP-B4668]
MMKRNNTLKEIVQKYLLGKASLEEEARVDRFYQELESEKDITKEQSSLELQEIESRIFDNIKGQRHVRSLRRSRVAYWRWAAAVLLPLFLTGGYYWRLSDSPQIDLHNVAPGKMSANLIMESGEVYSLASLADLEQLEDKGIYREDSGLETAMHEIVTPRGGYYQLQLPDGTSVWLNAASSIRFPAHFENDKREVFLSGEAYFDVTHNEQAPFIVHTGLQSTKVLGTKFNITSYPGQHSDVVTLIEGSVEASSKHNEKVRMTPGHQAHIGQHIHYIALDNAVDVAAWRKGEFYFDNTPMREVMTMIGRWYNIEVNLENLPSNKLNGLINRNVPLNQLLDLIETTSNVKIITRDGKLSVDINQDK